MTVGIESDRQCQIELMPMSYTSDSCRSTPNSSKLKGGARNPKAMPGKTASNIRRSMIGQNFSFPIGVAASIVSIAVGSLGSATAGFSLTNR